MTAYRRDIHHGARCTAQCMHVMTIYQATGHIWRLKTIHLSSLSPSIDMTTVISTRAGNWEVPTLVALVQVWDSRYLRLSQYKYSETSPTVP